VLQGIVGGAIQPVAQAIIFEAFPPAKRGMSMAVVGIGAMFAPMIGPTVGGYLVDYINWRWIFYVNLPFGIIAVLMTMLIIRESKTRVIPFDLWGFSLMATFLTTILLAVSQGNSEGWGSEYIVGLFVVGGLSFAAFLIVELWRREPLIDLRLFAYQTYSAGTLSSIVMGVGLFGGVFLLPVFLQTLMGYDAVQTGLLLFPQGLAVAFMMPIAGSLVNRVDPRILMSAGMLVMGWSLILQAGMTPETSTWTLISWTLLRGVGMGLAFPAMNQTTLGAVPLQKIGMASGMLNVTRQLGGSFGIAFLTTLLTQRTVFHQTILGQDAARTSASGPLAMQIQQHAMALGATPLEAKQQAGAVIGAMMGQQVAVSAFQDAFYAAGILMIFGIIPALFVVKKPQSGPPSAAAHVMAE
jgi:DHA2 family multidrug resistance protein